LELTAVHKDGREFPIELSVSSLPLGNRWGAVGIIRDITQRKEKEAQLRQAQKMEVVGQLTGGVAHDFNNLLTIILGNLRLLNETLDGDPEASELADDALSAARDGAELTQRLLTFSRKQILRPEPVDVNALLVNFGRFLQRTLREDVELRITRSQEVAAVLADPGHLQHALLNLAVNARDAMPRGGNLILENTRKHIGPSEATAYPELAPGDYVIISVSDTGIGMTPEDTARAVEPFFTTKQHGEGSGLGLSMVYGFARQSGGGVLIRSEFGKGTRVSVLLPETAARVPEGDSEPPARDVQRGSETLLVVEDQSKVRKFATQSLKGLGYRVLEAEHAAAAIKTLEAEPGVALLFSDIVMPGPMNGRELARWAVAHRPGLKVLLTTGFSKETGSVSPADEDDFSLLKKPYTREHLGEAVRVVLDAQ
jgi:signal transduction histidine kinase/CheY-like chemotaxis protein